MGCAPSLCAKVDQNDVEADKFAPPEPIPVDVGSGVRKRPSGHQTVVFIFGGPGSQKGLVVEELIQRFDFISINVEEIIFSYLPNKMASSLESTADIQELLKRDPSALSMDWILSLISAKVSTSMSQRFVIDIVPALTNIMKSNIFIGESHDRALEQFERKHPISFALELNVCDEKSMLGDRENNGKEGKENQKKELSAELNAFLKGIDEADKGRLEVNAKTFKRRLDLYHKCANGFLNYFHKTKRVIRMNIFGTTVTNIVTTVRDMLSEFGFSRNSNTKRVLLFTTASCAQEQFEEIDLDYYKIRRVRLSEICKDSNERLISQIQSVKKFVQRTGKEDENFVIILDNLNNNDRPKNKKINFMERKRVYLDEFISDRLHRTPLVRMKVSVNAITSPADQVLLFLEPFPTRLALKIGNIICGKEYLDGTHSDAETYTPTREDT